MALRTAAKILLSLVLGLPILLAVLGWVIGLLTAMGDQAAAAILRQLNTGVSVLWLVCIVGLVIVMALETFESQPGDPPDE